MGVVRLGALAVVLLPFDAAERGDPQRDRHVDATADAHAHLRDVIDHLLHRRIAERVELHLDHRPPSGETQPDSSSGDPRFADGSVEDASLSVLGLEPVGHPENATGSPHVLAEHEDTRVLGQRVVQRPVERARHRPFRHPSASSRCRSREGGGSAYTQSNIHSIGGGGDADLECERIRLLLARRHEPVVGVAGGEEPAPEPCDRIRGAGALHLGVVAVSGRVVGRRVRSDPVGHRLDQRGPVTSACALERASGGPMHREHVVPVDPDAREPVPLRPAPDLPRRLFRGRQADRPAVVLAEQHHRQAPDARQVRRLVEVSFARRSVAEVRHRDRVRPVEPLP